ncbi:MAG: efflux RND transporter periplasmic adaptor subunit [Nitrospirae bacterium]|nr:efflux RND transporter periplasmic adaptor subunit [Nitrospirota bacterium]
MAHQAYRTTTVTLFGFLGGVIVTVLVGWWVLSSHMAAAGGMERSSGMANRSEMKGMDMSGGNMAGMKMDPGAKDPGQAPVTLSPTRRQTIGVKTGVVERRPFETTIRAVGIVAYDERRVKQVNLRVAGWVTNLAVNYTGQSVRAGEPLLTIYSPELAATQAEYRLARRTQARIGQSAMEPIRVGADAQVQAAAERLRRLNVSEEQIEALENQEPRPETTLVAPISGVVMKKMALQGGYATPDMPLYEIADLSTVWVHAQVYEQDLSLVALGREAEVTLAAYPNEVFRGRVVFIDPVLAPETRTTPVRMEIPNPDLRLKPGMYGDVTIRVQAEPVLAVPREAVLDSGTRTLAFLDRSDGRFEPRDIKTGRTFGDYTEVIEGLQAGDTIVTSGTFLIDSESKLMAATNMMGALGMGGIRMEQAQMGQMEMGGMEGMPGMKGMKEMAGMEGGDMKSMPGMSMGAADTPSTQTIDGLTLTLETVPAPAKKGGNTVRVTVLANDAPVTNAAVTVAYTMAMPGMEVETVKAGHTKDGVYEATVDLPMKGAWKIDATVTRPNAKPVTAHVTVQAGK